MHGVEYHLDGPGGSLELLRQAATERLVTRWDVERPGLVPVPLDRVARGLERLGDRVRTYLPPANRIDSLGGARQAGRRTGREVAGRVAERIQAARLGGHTRGPPKEDQEARGQECEQDERDRQEKAGHRGGPLASPAADRRRHARARGRSDGAGEALCTVDHRLRHALDPSTGPAGGSAPGDMREWSRSRRPARSPPASGRQRAAYPPCS